MKCIRILYGIYPVMYTTNHAISAMFNGEEFDCNKQH